ncbi:MAG: hypothetical protein ACD_78C00329G0001 [uncultured bacterium (gcode 4)]|uniref:Uncharacterized protein n=1 Tax=uncultured bacterium (gcode 4) TaxID=1234023 RepID=K1YBE7_9BACT|nr:MAG: hypothetical protein ACD_78C00329G0001 [uncultured bacterium (gcode 4)]
MLFGGQFPSEFFCQLDHSWIVIFPFSRIIWIRSTLWFGFRKWTAISDDLNTRVFRWSTVIFFVQVNFSIFRWLGRFNSKNRIDRCFFGIIDSLRLFPMNHMKKFSIILRKPCECILSLFRIVSVGRIHIDKDEK